MRKLLCQLTKAIPLILLMLAFIGANAQRRYSPLVNTDVRMTLNNDVQVDSKTLEFDLYLLDTDGNNTFEMATCQAGIIVNSGIYAGGTISVAVVAGSSTLTNSAQVPNSIIWVQSVNCIKVTPRSAPGAGNGSIIATAGLGTKICRLRITNTVNFTSSSTANLAFSFLTNPYPTKCFGYIGGSNTQVSTTATNCYSSLTNVVLNGGSPPVPYNVGGTGSYCEGGAGLPVTLDNSQTGVTYQLFKNTVAGATQAGTDGLPISFTGQTAGTYTIVGTNGYGVTNMTGSATISMNSNCSFSWVGGVSTDWFTATNWSGGIVPLATNNVTIPFPSARYPLISGATTAVCGTVAIQSGASITVSGKFSPSGTTTVSGTLGLVILDGGSYIDNGIAGAGTEQVQKTFSTAKWHYISSPISDAVTGLFTADWLCKYYTEYANGWTPWSYYISNAIPLNQEQGYGAYINVLHTSAKLFTGHLNTNAAPYACITQLHPVGNGFNLVGNAYPSAINLANANITWPSASHTAWFWDPANQNYYVYNGTGLSHSQYAPAIQGFFIETSAAGNFQVPNSARVHNSEAFLKENNNLPNILKLNAISQVNSMQDEAFVGFIPGTTTGYDYNFDAAKLPGGNEAPQLFTLLQDNQKVSFNIQPAVNENTVVPMGFTCGVNGNYTINASNLESFDASAKIYLEDLKEGNIQDMKANPLYAFVYATGDAANRFVLHFSGPTGINDQHANGVQVYSYESSLYIKNLSNQSLKNVFVYDLLGKDVFHSALNQSPLQKFVLGINPGYYVVKVVSESGVTTQKVYIN